MPLVSGPLAQDLLADHRNADHLTEEVHNLLRARETAEVAVNVGVIKDWTGSYAQLELPSSVRQLQRHKAVSYALKVSPFIGPPGIG
jgi:hypothetical protein